MYHVTLFREFFLFVGGHEIEDECRRDEISCI